MHLGRFHKAVEQLESEYQSGNYAKLFDNLINSLSSVASQPGNPELATAYKQQLEFFRQALSTSDFNSPRPVLQTILASIAAEQYVGNRLFARIMAAISTNPATPSIAVQELQKLKEETANFYKNILAIHRAFSELEVEYESLDEGEGELGILIPRNANTATLSQISKEFKEWSKILSPLSEVFDPDAGPLQIKTCATTDWTVYLIASYPILKGVSLCLKEVNTILRELSETRELIERLAKRSKSPKAIEDLEEENKNKLGHEIRGLAEKVVDENYKMNDDARKNELKNAVDGALKLIVKKVSEGAKIELKYIAPQTPSVEDGEDGAESETSLTEQEALALQLDQEISLIDFSESKSHVQSLLANENMETEQQE